MTVLLLILLFLVLLLLLPVGAHVIYSSEGLRLAIAAGPVQIQLLPKKQKDGAEDRTKKKKKPKKSKDRKSKKNQKAEKAEKKKAEKDSGAKGKGQPLGGKISFFMELIGIGLKALGCLLHKLRMDRLTLHMTMAGRVDDPAGVAINCGRAWAGIGSIVPMLENNFIVRDRDLNVEVDFEAEETVIYAEAQITIRIGDVLWVALHYGIKILIVFLKNKRAKKKMKGGMQNGSSDQ